MHQHLPIMLSTARLLIKSSGRFIGFRLRTQFVRLTSWFICDDATAYSYCCSGNRCVSCLLIIFLCASLLCHIWLLSYLQRYTTFFSEAVVARYSMYCKLIIYRQLTLKKLFFPDHRKFVFLKTNTDVILSCKILNIELVVNSWQETTYPRMGKKDNYVQH